MKEEVENWGFLLPKGMYKDSSSESLPHFEVKYAGNVPLMYQVWTEGYAASGEHANAVYHGECLAMSFEEACEKLIKGLDRNSDGTLRLMGGKPAIWGCRCFDNEGDARKSFG